MSSPPATAPHILNTTALSAGRGRVDEADLRFPSYTPLMLSLTLAYLILTLSFGARVLDTVGTGLSWTQLGSLAIWNQALFGSALALALWGGVLLPRWERSAMSWRLRWLILVSAGILCVVLSVALQKAAVMWLTETPAHAPAGTRERKAAQLSLLVHATTEAGIVVPGLGMDPDHLNTPAGKAFLALAMASDMIDPDGAQPADGAVRVALQALVAQRLGTAAQVYDNMFVPSVRSLKDAYNAYVAAQTALVDEIKAIVEQQNRAWNDYLEGLARRGLSLAKLTRADWPALAAEVRQTGVAVPADWNPADRAAYVTALSTPQRKLADAQYSERLHRLFGADLPPGLEWDQFHANPIVQARWRAAINAPTATPLSPAMGFPAFESTVYRPMIDQLIQPHLQAALAPPASYGPGGAMAQLGEAAALRIALPLIALVLICIGLLWHGCALAAYAARLVLPAWPARRRCLTLALGILGLCVLGARSPVTRSDGFHRLQDQIADRAGPAWLAALGMVEVHGFVQPLGETLRRTLLGQQDFGLDPFANHKADQQTTLDRLLP